MPDETPSKFDSLMTFSERKKLTVQTTRFAEFPIGAIIGISAAAVIIVVIIIIVLMVKLSRKESHVLKPVDFVDRPVPGIRTLGVSHVSKHKRTGSKYTRPRWYSTKRNVPRHQSAAHGVWTTRESWEYEFVPLIRPNQPGYYNRDSDVRTSANSNVSAADLDTLRQSGSRNAVYVIDNSGMRNDNSHITLSRERSQRISNVSDADYQGKRRSYTNPTMQTFRL